LTTDGLLAYIAGVDEMLMDRCDYAQLVKTYAQPAEDEKRYSQQNAREPSRLKSAETRTSRKSALPTWNAKISPCGCRSAG
jgi:hypothetical protein